MVDTIGADGATSHRDQDDVLVRAREHAEEVSQAKSDFLSRMSHELRTPLSAVLGFAELLEMEDLDERKREYVAAIVKAGNHMARLINDVLDMSRIEAGKMTLSLEPVPLGPLLYDTVNLVRPLGRSRRIMVQTEFSRGAPGHVLADAQRLQQVLVNLCANAIKYNRDEGQVLITVSGVKPGRARIDVTDTGTGIVPQYMNRLFTPFDRLDAGNTQVEGTGLGLALSKFLAEAMGGTIAVTSSVGVGSTFSVELPQATGPEAVDSPDDLAAALSPAAYDAPQTVLYIEDTVSNVELITRILGLRPSITLVTATRGEGAVELACQHRPGLVLLDMHLPDIDGEEVLANLKSDERTRAIPVIGLSADASAPRIRRVLGAGARDYITKPVNVRHFLETVDGVLAGS
ncbi:MAG: ATP-binding protein [Candidatus Dormibacteria bacterium]